MDRDFLSVVAKRTGKPDEVESLYQKDEDGNEKLVDTWKETVNSWIDNWQTDTNKRAQLHGASTTAKNYRNKLAEALGLEESSDEAIFSTIDTLKGAKPPNGEAPAQPDGAFEKVAERLRSEREDWKRKYTDLQSQMQRAELTRAAHNRALSHLAKLNWNAGSDEPTRQKRTRHITDILDAHIALGKLKLEDGELAVYAGQERAKDTDYRPVTFEQYVSELNAFGVHAGNPNNGSPAPAPSNGSAGSKGHLSQDQILEQYMSEKDPARKAELRKAMDMAR